jgi:phenylpropionate dioxygenase-like ring-hydroxylating dioxygenase large terminal subunit
VTTFVYNQWYAAAWNHEVGRKLFSRRILDNPVLFYRTEAGAPVALLDRCPHRNTPLSLGTLRADTVECGYHGLTFDCSGQCVRIPGQTNIPRMARVRAFPCAEKYGLIWVWPGDPALADQARLFDIPNWGKSGWGLSCGPYTRFETNYLNITDNLVDPAHTTFVHKRTIGSAAAEDVPVTTEQQGDTVVVGRWIANSAPVPLMQRFGSFRGNVDRWQYYYLYPPCVSKVDFGAINAGAERSEEAMNRGFRIFSFAMLTPETENSTHYFWLQLRNFHPDDEATTKELVPMYAATFEEDQVILAAIQRANDEVGDARLLRLAIDNASLRVRRVIERLIKEEGGRGAAMESPNIAASAPGASVN